MATIQEQIIGLQEGIDSEFVPDKIKKQMKERLAVLLEKEGEKEKSERKKVEKQSRTSAAKAAILAKAEKEAEKLSTFKAKQKAALKDKAFDCDEAEQKWRRTMANAKKASKKKKKENKKSFTQIYPNKASKLANWVANSKKFRHLTVIERNNLKRDLLKHYVDAQKVFKKFKK